MYLNLALQYGLTYCIPLFCFDSQQVNKHAEESYVHVHGGSEDAVKADELEASYLCC